MRGFSLIELLVALVIVSIVAAVAYPTYGNYAKRAHRLQAQAVLLEASLYLQYFYARNDRYDAENADSAPVELPSRLHQSPSESAAKYKINLLEVHRNSYVLQATPTGTMTGDACGTFRLAQTGEKSLSPDATLSMGECWR